MLEKECRLCKWDGVVCQETRRGKSRWLTLDGWDRHYMMGGITDCQIYKGEQEKLKMIKIAREGLK